eukprot:CCRYP_004191-RB/>CCRYP_004191-RB protein AED:0.40 eAED:0.78 QI:0/-1/0/1/-1/0/1/0/31
MQGKSHHNKAFSTSWDIHDCPLPYKSTTPLL